MGSMIVEVGSWQTTACQLATSAKLAWLPAIKHRQATLNAEHSDTGLNKHAAYEMRFFNRYR